MGQNYRINTRPKKNSKYPHAPLTSGTVILLCIILFCLSEAAFFFFLPNASVQCDVKLGKNDNIHLFDYQANVALCLSQISANQLQTT